MLLLVDGAGVEDTHYRRMRLNELTAPTSGFLSAAARAQTGWGGLHAEESRRLPARKKGEDIGEDQRNTFRAVLVNRMSSWTLRFNIRKVACKLSHRPI